MTTKLIRRTKAAILLLSLAAPLSGCKEKEEAAPAKPPEVEVFTVEQKDVPIYRDWVGTLEGDVNATISAQVTGYLVSRNYTEGTMVTNGQVLFQIEKAPFQATLDKAKAQLGQAEAQREKYALNVQRYRPLVAKEAISQQELDDAVQNERSAAAQADADKAAIEQAALNLGFTTIRSPLDGIAGLAQAQVGDLLSPSSGPLTTVTKVEPMRVYFSVSQQLVTEMQQKAIAEGKQLRETGEFAGPMLELILASGYVYPEKGRVRFANNQVDVKTGTVRVVGEFPNPQKVLVPGMFVRVRAHLDTVKNALLVPQRAVTDMQGQYLIAVVGADNKVSIHPVTASERVGPDWIISGKVKAGDRVVAEGIQKVRDGAEVTAVPFKQTTPVTLATPSSETEKEGKK
jgi:membrane fusion protein (multidrug efflux system)